MISIVIVNWNSGEQLFDAVESIEKYHNSLVSSVVIVDNASTDSSLKKLEVNEYPSFSIKIIRNKKNNGFGVACNQGAALVTSDYLLFLNPDTRLFEESLIVPYLFMQEPINSKVGVVGIQLVDSNNNISRSCARFPTLTIFLASIFGINYLPIFSYINMHMFDWDHLSTKKVDHVIGAFYFIRTKLFNEVNGFDPRFFVYLEDLDLSKRIYKSGFYCVYLTNAKAFHYGGGTSKNIKAKRLFYSLDSRLSYGFKYFSLPKALILLLLTLILEPFSRIFFSLLKGTFNNIFNILEAYKMLVVNLVLKSIKALFPRN